MTDSNDSRMVRLPVRNMRDETKPQCPMCGDMGGPEFWSKCKAATCEMRDEPAPQRAAQEGGLPPLPAQAFPDPRYGMSTYPGYTADQMREYARTAIAAAGGGVPHDALIQARDMLENWSSYVPPYFAEKHGLKDDFATLDKWIAAAPEAPAQAAPSAGEVERAAHELLRTLDHGAYPREDIDLDLVRLVCDAALSHKEPKP